MSLASGSRLGPFEIVAPLGAGGMGEVYRARDTRLGREVAVKVLPEEVSGDAERLRRFEQEAKAASTLNHPAILTVHDFGAERGIAYLVTELLEGRTLRVRLQEGPLPPRQAALLGAEVARGLAAAHEKGIVHRDLKPENLFLLESGTAKILDVGLARFDAAAAGVAKDATTLAETEAGRILGTVGYMAPEQVRGERIDARADLFALGCVLYECLAGRRAFARDTAVETMSAILKEEPPSLGERGVEVPPALARVVERCLAKSPKERFQSARDLAFALDGSVVGTVAASGAPRALPFAPARRRRGAAARHIASALAGAALATLALLWLRAGAAPPPAAPPGAAVGELTHLTVDPGFEGDATLSPDGESFAYFSDRSGDFEIYLQQVGGGDAINLSRHPGDDVQPAFSPDGRQIAFVSTRESETELVYRSPGTPLMGGDLWVVPALGGAPRRIAERANFPAWSPDGASIYFTRGRWFRSEIRRVAAAGGESELVPFTLPGRLNPPFIGRLRVSPDARWLLFTAAGSVLVMPVAGGEARPLAVGRDAIWDPSGAAILYCRTEAGRNSGLWRARYWVDGEGPHGGAPEPLLVGPAALERPEISRSGRRLVVTALAHSANLEALALDAESGRVGGPPVALTRGQHDVSFSTVSPDGRSIIFQDGRASASHLWRLDEGREPFQLTDDAAWEESYPRWSPDGRTVAFDRRPARTARQPTNAEIWLMSPDGGGPRRLVEKGGNMAWLPDSRRLVYVHTDRFYLVDVASGAARELDLGGVAAMPIFSVSPDGAWLVFQTTSESDVDLIVLPLGGGEPRRIASTRRDDYHPLFSPSGRWLYFQPDHRNLWRVPGPTQGWREAAPEKITSFPESGLYLEEPQLTADGRRFIYARNTNTADLWLAELTVAGRPDP